MSLGPFTVPRRDPAPIAPTGSLRAGAALRDITPALGAPLSGFGAIRSEVSRRLWGRLFTVALVIDDGAGGRVALVAADLHAGTRYLAELIAADVAPDTGIGIDRLFFSGSHTHSGPGHIYGNTLYDGMAAGERGIDRVTSRFLADGIAAAIREATASLRPAKIGHGVARRWGYSMNRSLRAFSNEGARPDRFARAQAAGDPIPAALSPENLAVDPRAQVLWAEDLDGVPIGAFAIFAAHGTAIPARQATLSADWCGCAVREAQDRILRADEYWPAGATRRRIPLGFAAGAVGDVDVDLPGLDIDQIVGIQGTALARDIGDAVGATLERACHAARASLQTELSIRTRFVELEPAGAWLDDGRRLGGAPAFGIPAIGGSELGRNFTLDADVLASSVNLESRRSDYNPDNPHSPKLTVDSPLVGVITGRPPSLLPLRLVMLEGPSERLWLSGVPGEPTTMFAFRLERTLRDLGASSVMIAGVTGDYAGYFTTPSEYDRQHYEGACTIWGRGSSDWLLERYRALASAPLPPLAREARFESDADFTPPATAPGHATRPMLSVHEGELLGGWTAPASVLPPFAPDAWILLEELRGDHFAPLALDSVPITDQSREMFVERALEGEKAVWSFRYAVPSALRGRTIRFVLAQADFGLAGVEAISNPVRVE
jgi:neutral ceramidase